MQGRKLSTVNFDDQDWDLEAPSPRPRNDPSAVWKVAAGIAVGILIGAALVWTVDPRAAWPETTAVINSPEPLRLPAEPTAAGEPTVQPEPTLAAAPAAESVPASLTSRTAGPPGADDKAALAADRKERAWARFYKKPAACEETPPKASMVECANHFIRAKREFEQLFEAGKGAPARPAVPASRSASGP